MSKLFDVIESPETPISAERTDTLDFKIDTIELQRSLLGFWSDKIGILISREERDLLGYALLTSNNVGFVKLFSYCEKTDLAIATYERLHEKIISIYPKLKLDKKIRFFNSPSYTLKTQEQIDAIIDDIYSKPTPFNQICLSKNLKVMWYQNNNGNVGIMKMPIINSFAKDLSKAILSRAKDDSFSWSKDKNGGLDGCSIEIKSADELDYFLGDLIKSPSKTSQEQIVKLRSAVTEANNLEPDTGVNIFFQTKAPVADKSEKKEWVKPPMTHYTLTDLKERKWSKRLIEKYLEEPDVYFENTRNRHSPTHGYEIARVKKIEKTSTFKADFQLNRK